MHGVRSAPAALPADSAILEAWFDNAPNRERSGRFGDMKLAGVKAVLAQLTPPPAPVTIAGTKGKGSTLRFLEQVLLAHGRSTVSFTSPHVRRIHERWRVDGMAVDDVTLATACSTVAAAEQRAECPLTYFERCFAVACVLAAARPQADFLCEVGLGGRLDCANALDAAISILTQVSRDHCRILGYELSSIAREKLAIGRPGRPALIAPQSAEAAEAIRSVLPEGPMHRWIAVPAEAAAWPLGIRGAHQLQNAATALAAAELVLGKPLDPSRRDAGLSATRLAARSHLIETGGRRVLIDGAHNDASLAAVFAHAAQTLRPGWRLILGIAADKDVEAVLRFLPRGLIAHRCGYQSERSRGREDWPAPADAWPWHDGIAAALAAQPAGSDLCIAGSFYLAGEALRLLDPGGQLPG